MYLCNLDNALIQRNSSLEIDERIISIQWDSLCASDPVHRVWDNDVPILALLRSRMDPLPLCSSDYSVQISLRKLRLWTQYSLIAVMGVLSASRITVLSPLTTLAVIWMLFSITRVGILSRLQSMLSLLLATVDFCGNLLSSFSPFHVIPVFSFSSLVVATLWICFSPSVQLSYSVGRTNPTAFIVPSPQIQSITCICISLSVFNRRRNTGNRRVLSGFSAVCWF